MPYEEISGLHGGSTWYKTEDNFFYKKNRTNSPNSTVQHLICINNKRSQKQLDISPEAPFCRGKINCYLLSFHNDFTNRIYLSLSATAKIDQDGLTLRSQHTHTPGTQSFFVPLSFKGHQDLKMSFFVLYRTKCVPFPVEMPCLVGLLCKCGQKIDVSPGCSKILLIWDCVPPPRRSSSRGSAQKKTSRASPASLKSAETRKRLRQGEAVREKGDT